MSKKVRKTIVQRQEEARQAMKDAQAKHEEKMAYRAAQVESLTFQESVKDLNTAVRNCQFSDAHETLRDLSENMPTENVERPTRGDDETDGDTATA